MKSNFELPHIYWLPKLHKSPPKARFIIAAPNNALKPVSKALTAILKLFIGSFEKYETRLNHELLSIKENILKHEPNFGKIE